MEDLVRQPYFYDGISREEAERYLKQSGVKDGKFLLRKRPTDSQSFVLSFCHKRVVIHYHIQHHQDGKYGIEDGPRFISPIELIDYHRANQGGLLTKLTKPCNRPEGVEPNVYTNANYKNIRALDFTRLTLKNKLDRGGFGSVLKGAYTFTNGWKIECAVKTQKSEIGNRTRSARNWEKSEIEHEARIMLELDHPHIVRMIGMCQQPTMMLVLELAINGPLHKYLLKQKEVTIRHIFVMLLQVSDGMEYLDSKHFVYRNLAARNVLVVNVNFVKISNFRMSRAMGVGNNYYQAEAAGKWPLKWYAPECIYYYEFTTKSDVWSYGITLWEALTYGGKPYEGLNYLEAIQYWENEERLTCPLHCPESVYSLMRACWEFEPGERLQFSLVKETLSDILHFMQ